MLLPPASTIGRPEVITRVVCLRVWTKAKLGAEQTRPRYGDEARQYRASNANIMIED
ncbi:hypothetical protein P4H39_07525 [Paenibacillus lautus]|uniref:hypothetical protein n=1 Tax=Paenibacillus lautus TaxID=1401 RepID=UPI002DBDC4D8|nr:hypothetical protein [Paenibacillus lautus]MEC0202469.1 hypothetical protein [Paenibacillus lautus]